MAGEDDQTPEQTDRDKQLECLKDATKRLQDAEAAKKRDSRLHTENIKAVKDEIADIMDQLDGKD